MAHNELVGATRHQLLRVKDDDSGRLTRLPDAEAIERRHIQEGVPMIPEHHHAPNSLTKARQGELKSHTRDLIFSNTTHPVRWPPRLVGRYRGRRSYDIFLLFGCRCGFSCSAMR